MSLAVAIKSRWEAAGLASSFPGGLWYEKAPAETPYPFQVFLILGQTFDGRTSTTLRRRAAFEIHTYYKVESGEDPQEEVEALVAETEEAFDHQLLNVSDRTVLLTRQNDSRTFEEDYQIYRGLNEFDLTLYKSR
jgi:hypothetical protein